MKKLITGMIGVLVFSTLTFIIFYYISTKTTQVVDRICPKLPTLMADIDFELHTYEYQSVENVTNSWYAIFTNNFGLAKYRDVVLGGLGGQHNYVCRYKKNQSNSATEIVSIWLAKDKNQQAHYNIQGFYPVIIEWVTYQDILDTHLIIWQSPSLERINGMVYYSD